jgi:hypothetical protein
MSSLASLIARSAAHRKNKVITLANISPKSSKSNADYINYARDKRCQDCKMFRPPGECTAVKGDISPVGHCRFWEAKAKLPIE